MNRSEFLWNRALEIASGRRVLLLCAAACVLLLLHPGADALLAYHGKATEDPGAYVLTQRRLTDRVVLIVVDSWPVRIVEGPRWMPKLFARIPKGASGVLWAPLQTGTMQGILTLSTGVPPSGLSAIELVSTQRFDHWTVFDDVVARGEQVLFSGGPAWVELFGDRGTDNFRESGHGPMYRDDDVQGLAHLEAALLSPKPPALSVIHISETDFAAHQFGTTGSSYAAVMRFWDDSLDQFLQRVLIPGTTVIVTADHGNDLLGSHGGSDAIYRRVPVLMWGSGIMPGSKIEMQARDMPATMAVLLGVRAPAGVLGLPAVEAMDLPGAERDRLLRVAYEQTVLKHPRVAQTPELLARARSPLVATTILVEAESKRSASVPSEESLPGFRAVLGDIESQLTAVRVWSVLDWAFVALSFAIALVFGRFAWIRIATHRDFSVRQLVAWAGAFVVVELLFVVRVVFSGAIKRALHAPQLELQIGICCALALAIPVLVYASNRRTAVLEWCKAHLLACVVLGYLLTTILRPWDTLGLLGITMVAAFAYSSRWPLRVRVITTAAFAVYFSLGSLYMWPMLGERVSARYVVGLPMALIGVVVLALLQKRYPSQNQPHPYAQLLSLGFLLILLPAGGLGLAGWSAGNFAPLASLLLVLMCCWILVLGKPPWWAWLGPVLVVTFWSWPSAVLFSNALGTCALLLCLALAGYRERHDCRLATFILLTSMLLLTTSPNKALSLFLLLGVLIAFIMSSSAHDDGEQASDVVVFAALFVVACRYAIFGLFGNSDSMLSFGLQDIDIRSAYVGNEQRAIVPAVLLALLKIWLAGAVLFAALGLFRQWRRWLVAIAALAGAFALINIGQTSVQAALATGVRTSQYEWAAFSVFANTGIFVFAVLSFAGFASFAEDRHSRNIAQTVPAR